MEAKYVFIEAAYKSHFTASHACPFGAADADKDRGRAVIRHNRRTDADHDWMYYLHRFQADVVINGCLDCDGNMLGIDLFQCWIT